jgi:HEAT repeats
MRDSINEISRWLQSRSFQDNPEHFESSAERTFRTWDEWVKEGKKISDLENGLVWMLQHDQDPVNRAAAALALGFVGEAQSIRALIGTLKADIPMVAMEAAASLGRRGGPEAIEPLCESLKSADSNVRASACTALGSLDGENALACLREAEKDKDPFVKTAAQEALRRNK